MDRRWFNSPVAAIGAGSWGTTLAALLAGKGISVRLWAFEAELPASINSLRENGLFLPGIKLPDGLTATNSLQDALSGASVILSSVPSHAVRGVFKDAARCVEAGALVVSASKGIEDGTYLTPTGVLTEVLGGGFSGRIVALSGPTFAKEVSRGLPTAVTAACAGADEAKAAQEIFSTPYFRVYTNPDTIGVEVGGAMKNVIAIAAGISDGLGLGSNARAALITRGLAEIARLGVRMGANASTFYGLSGLGDLVLTAAGDLSRNRTVGIEIGKGRNVKEILSGMRAVAEGVKTSLAAKRLADKLGVEMPITSEVHAVIYEGKPPKDAVLSLMARGLKEEA